MPVNSPLFSCTKINFLVNDHDDEFEGVPELLPYDVFDVKGDGNCGMYCFLYARYALGITHHVNGGKRNTRDAVMALRKEMFDYGNANWKEFVKLNKDAMVKIGAIEGMVDEVQRTIYDEETDYFSDDYYFNSDLHMEHQWGPFIFAVMEKIKVIVIKRDPLDGRDSWETSVYDGRKFPFKVYGKPVIMPPDNSPRSFTMLFQLFRTKRVS